MKISQYIIVKKVGNRYGAKYSSRMTVGSPSLLANEIAVMVSIEVPDAIFDKPSLQANIVVPEDAVSKPIISAEVVDNIQEIIKQNTGFTVKLELIEKEAVAE